MHNTHPRSVCLSTRVSFPPCRSSCFVVAHFAIYAHVASVCASVRQSTLFTVLRRRPPVRSLSSPLCLWPNACLPARSLAAKKVLTHISRCASQSSCLWRPYSKSCCRVRPSVASQLESKFRIGESRASPTTERTALRHKSWRRACTYLAMGTFARPGKEQEEP